MFDATLFLPAANGRRSAVPYVPVVSDFTNVRWSRRGPPKAHSRRGAKRVGLDYERRVLDVLSAIYEDRFVPSPVIDYMNGWQMKSAIPDGILRLDGDVIVVEVKLRHTSLVWPQLMERYLPLVQLLEPRSRIRTVEVCRSYDPSIVLPGGHTCIDSLHHPSKLGLEVLQWKI